MTLVALALRQRVRLQARNFCEYCRSHSDLTGHDFTVDHITPLAAGGTDDFANLSLCCFWCNSFKNSQTHGVDGRQQARVQLFNPRLDTWTEHFRWSPTATRIVGRTAVGRATVLALRLNRPTLVRARHLWARYGLHPPE